MIERSVVVRVSVEHAFRVWTEKVGMWWPPGHRVSGDPSGRLVLEPKAGGRFYERTDDGRELDYGEVIEWAPPALLRYHWFLGADREHPTEVQVRFVAVEGGTRVEVTHRPGRLPEDRYRQTAPRFEQGWGRVLDAYGAHLSATKTTA